MSESDIYSVIDVVYHLWMCDEYVILAMMKPTRYKNVVLDQKFIMHVNYILSNFLSSGP